MDNSIYFTLSSEECKEGESKFFGSPDLPENFDWPIDEDGYDMEFICQINCAEAHKFNSEMPENGMLYFFGCIANPLGEEDAPAVKPGFQSAENFAVRYTSLPVNDLQSGEIVDEAGNPAGFGELQIQFSMDENVCTEMCHKLLGDFPETDSAEDLSEYSLLFSLDSFSGDDFTLEFEDCGYLYFLIKPEDLKNRNFDKTICYLAV